MPSQVCFNLVRFEHPACSNLVLPSSFFLDAVIKVNFAEIGHTKQDYFSQYAFVSVDAIQATFVATNVEHLELARAVQLFVLTVHHSNVQHAAATVNTSDHHHHQSVTTNLPPAYTGRVQHSLLGHQSLTQVLERCLQRLLRAAEDAGPTMAGEERCPGGSLFGGVRWRRGGSGWR